MDEYWELIDDLGHDFYRVDLATSQVSMWSVLESAWFDSALTYDELMYIGSGKSVLKFEEVTGDDVR